MAHWHGGDAYAGDHSTVTRLRACERAERRPGDDRGGRGGAVVQFAGLSHAFPTAVVGSLPRAAWLLDRWEEQQPPQVVDRRRLDYLPEWYKAERPADRPRRLRTRSSSARSVS